MIRAFLQMMEKLFYCPIVPLGHPPAHLLTFGVVCATLIAGTYSPDRLVWALLGALVCAAIAVSGNKWLSQTRHPSWSDAVIEICLVLLICAMCWTCGNPMYSENIALYRHGLLLVGAVLALGLAAGPLIAKLLFKAANIEERKTKAVHSAPADAGTAAPEELTVGPNPTSSVLSVLIEDPKPPTKRRFWIIATDLLLRVPLLILIITCGLFLFSERQPDIDGPAWDFVIYLFLIVLVLLATVETTTPDLPIRDGLYSTFCRGGALIVSAAIVILAILRAKQLTYVTALFDEQSTRYLFAFYCVSGYCLWWWYDYWRDYIVASELLKIVRETAEPANDTEPELKFQSYGASRYVVIRPNERISRPQEFSEFFERAALLSHDRTKSVDPPALIKQRVDQYRRLMTSVVVVIGLALFFWSRLHSPVQQAELTVCANDATGPVSLPTAFEILVNRAKDRPLILLAASGGGTRAALYTAAVLEGLKKTDHLQDVVVGSGVSGGALALAYFAAHRNDLLKSDTSWEDFFNAMKHDYIGDVIVGASEGRLLSGFRLGFRLKESMAHQIYQPSSTVSTLGGINDMGLVFNTSLAGHFSKDELCKDLSKKDIFYYDFSKNDLFNNDHSKNDLCGDLSKNDLGDLEHLYPKTTKSAVAGRRLIITNLGPPDAFKSEARNLFEGDPLVVVNNRNVDLATAAALSANFPPVFANAAVDVNQTDRYWITDGGAIDNLGVAPLLYAYLYCLKKNHGNPPRVVIIVADASLYSVNYTQDRGFNAMSSGGPQATSQLIDELWHEVESSYKEKDRLTYQYLPMPEELRTSGTFGTHWRLQPTIPYKLGNGKFLTIPGEGVIKVLRALHGNEEIKRTLQSENSDSTYLYKYVRDALPPRPEWTWQHLGDCLAAKTTCSTGQGR